MASFWISGASSRGTDVESEVAAREAATDQGSGLQQLTKRVRLEPERAGGADGIDPGILPPCGFVAAAVDLAMMAAAQRDGELIADLASERAVLREPKMMRIRGLAPTNQTWLFGHEFEVVLVPNPTRLREGEHALVDALGNGDRSALQRADFAASEVGLIQWRQGRLFTSVSRVSEALPVLPGTRPRRAARRLPSGCSWRQIRCAQVAAASAELRRSCSSARS